MIPLDPLERTLLQWVFDVDVAGGVLLDGSGEHQGTLR